MSLELVGGAALEELAGESRDEAPEPGTGALRVLIIVGHPRRQSLCQALAGAYGAGARRAGAQVRELRLAEESFDLNARSFDAAVQAVEPSIARARALLA
jgi:1,4-dihydroxy-2-naphthoate octaprenyltransferase